MRNVVLLLLSLSLIIGFSWTHGTAQQLIPENHYLVYEVPEVYSFTTPVSLVDQFGCYCVTGGMELDKFATPVDKNGEGLYDPMVHHTWWAFHQPQSVWWTTINNQFGEQLWQVTNGRYLLLPALKDTPGTPPPVANHYKCYDAIGPAVNVPVTLVDQYGTYSMVATEPVIFCNPTTKCIEGGQTEPIIEPTAHLACYKLEPAVPTLYTAVAYDQFGDFQVTLEQPCWLCLPTEKTHTVPTEPTTWGKIKAMYQD